ncbi:hypothetical protein [Neptuniibacter sp. QD37_11]|uniref:hypothetical protein n=1 Tax=Neptuniibacter sp. QD37_11 TaxID=3398209 RepID=UPI0039F4D583
MSQVEQDVSRIKDALSSVLPLLERNTGMAQAEYEKSAIPRGALEYTMSRHNSVHHLVNQDKDVIVNPLRMLAIAAPILPDLKTLVNNLEGDEQLAARAGADELMALYLEYGFTETCPAFDFPEHPEQDKFCKEALYYRETPEFIKPILEQPKNSTFTLVEPKKKAREDGSVTSIEINCNPSNLDAEVLKEAVRQGVLVMDSCSGPDPELNFNYTTYCFKGQYGH